MGIDKDIYYLLIKILKLINGKQDSTLSIKYTQDIDSGWKNIELLHKLCQTFGTSRSHLDTSLISTTSPRYLSQMMKWTHSLQRILGRCLHYTIWDKHTFRNTTYTKSTLNSSDVLNKVCHKILQHAVCIESEPVSSGFSIHIDAL